MIIVCLNLDLKLDRHILYMYVCIWMVLMYFKRSKKSYEARIDVKAKKQNFPAARG